MSDPIALNYTTYGIGPDKQHDDLQSLRDERDRLRANLVNCVARLEAYYGEDYPAVRDAKAALTPAGGVVAGKGLYQGKGEAT